MPWYELDSAADPKLAELARQYNLHPLHIEDVRAADESIKVEQTATYTFAVLKPIKLEKNSAGEITGVSFSTIDVFAGKQDGEPFFITVADPTCPTSQAALERARREGADEKPARLLYLILDTIVDAYFAAIDHYDDCIDELDSEVVSRPEPDTLQRVFQLKKQLIALRRVLVNTRDATLHLQRDPQSIIDLEHQPFVRDIYDHVVRLLDAVESQRDLTSNALDIYLSSLANRTNEVMKVLTVLGTIALPAIAISGIYGMNVKGLPFEESPHGALVVCVVALVLTVMLLVWLKVKKWF